jgi:hypothetical protein
MRFALSLFLFFLGAPAYAVTCTSLGSGNWSAPGTWDCGAMPAAGDDVVIANGHTVTMNVAAGQCRDLTFNGGNQDSYLSLAGANALAVSGNVSLTSNSNGDYRTLNVGNGVLTVAGNLTLVGPNNSRRSILSIANGTASVAGNITANSSGERIIFTGGGTLRVGGNWTSGGRFTRGTGSVVFDGAGAQSIPDYDFHHLTIAKAAGTATLSNTIIIYGNFTNNGGFDGIPGSDTVIFRGASPQTIGGTAGSSSFYRIDLRNANGLTLNHNVTVSNRFRFQNPSGPVTTGANTLSIGIGNGSPGTIAGSNASRYVNGNLARWIRNAGGTVAYDFPVGTSSRALVNLRFRAVTTGGYVRLATLDGDHPQIASSGINPALSVNRWWRVENLGVVFNPAAAQRRMIFNWVAADRDGGSTPSAFIAKRYAVGAWSDTDLTPVRTATSITLSPYMDFGEFAVGEPLTVVVPGGFDGLEPGAVFVPLNVPGNKNPIRTKVSGAALSIDIAAVNIAKDAILTTFVGDVRIELLNGSDVSAPLDANGCRTSWTPLTGFAPATLSFALADNGRKNISLNEPNAWRDVRLRMTYPAVGAPLAIGCSTDNFAIRPAVLGMAVTDSDWQTAGTTRTLNNAAFPGGTVHKSGQPFTITVTAYNALSAITTNYNGSPAASAVGFTLPALVGACPACVLGPGVFAGGGGTVVSNTATYSEVGVIQMQASDDTFAAVDAGDGSSVAERTAYSDADLLTPVLEPTLVGRFVPDHFTLTSGVVTAACGGFTYMNQPFQSLAATVQAQNASGAVTVNYDSAAFPDWRSPLDPLSLVDWQAENSNNGVDLSTRLNVAVSPPLWNSGVYSISVAVASFRHATPDNPDGPFDSLQLGVRLTDPDAVVLNSLDMNAATAGVCAPCNAKAVGAATGVRFGRLRLQNTHGSELRTLPLTVRSEFWIGSGFAVNGSDGCTALAAGDFSLSNWQGNLNLGETALAAGGPWTAVGGLFSGPGLTVPGLNNQGSVDVTVDLAARPWLRGRWNDAADTDADANTMHDDDPVARATFGIYRDRLIYRREITR